MLKALDLSWSTINDSTVEELVSSPTGHIRPGIKILNSRLFKLTELTLNGSDITDLSISQISKLPELKSLSIQGKCYGISTLGTTLKFLACVHITENGLQQFNDEECLAPLNDKLNIRDCCSLKPSVLPILTNFIKLKSPQSLILSETRNITKGNAIIISINYPRRRKFFGPTRRENDICRFIANKDEYQSYVQGLTDELKSTIEQKITFHRLKSATDL